MATEKYNYRASVALTITLISLASSSSLLAGQESDARDNTTDGNDDDLVGGRITTGTAPTAGYIEVLAVGQVADTPVWPDVFDGTNSAETVTSDAIKLMVCRPVAQFATDATANRSYDFGPVSIASLFGGVLPKKYSLFVTHSTVAALNSTAGNQYIHAQQVYRTIT